MKPAQIGRKFMSIPFSDNFSKKAINSGTLISHKIKINVPARACSLKGSDFDLGSREFANNSIGSIIKSPRNPKPQANDNFIRP